MTKTKVTISLDMDGNILDFYGVEGWLDYIIAEDTTPYAIAKPLLNFSLLARYLNKLQKNGYNLQIVSWLAKNGSAEYNKKVTAVKIAYLKKHLPSVHWDNIQILPYGTPKEKYCYTHNDILFDDEKNNREHWTGKAFDEKNILEILKKMLDK